MGERAHSGYEEAERAAFRALPWSVRLRANLTAFLMVCLMAAFALVLGFGYLVF